MAEATKVNVKVQLPGTEARQGQPDGRNARVTLAQVLNWIDSLPYDDETREALKKKVSKYPHATYFQFKAHLQRHVSNFQAARKQEQREAAKSKPVTPLDQDVPAAEEDYVPPRIEPEEFADGPSVGRVRTRPNGF